MLARRARLSVLLPGSRWFCATLVALVVTVSAGSAFARAVAPVDQRDSLAVVGQPSLLSLAAVARALEWAQRRGLAGSASTLERDLIADVADGRLDRHRLIEASLIACGVARRAKLEAYCERFDTYALRFSARVERTSTPEQALRAALEFLHAEILRGPYSLAATDIRDVLHGGPYNCVSSAALFCCLVDGSPVPLNVVEIPGHTYCVATLPGRSLDIETTCSDWFSMAAGRQIPAPGALAAWERSSPAWQRIVPTTALVGMVYYNRGVALLEEQDYSQAARSFVAALHVDPESRAAWDNLLATLNNWALDARQRGKLSLAAELLAEAHQLDPEHPLVLENAHALDRIRAERLLQQGETGSAMALLVDRAESVGDATDYAAMAAELCQREASRQAAAGRWSAVRDLFALLATQRLQRLDAHNTERQWLLQIVPRSALRSAAADAYLSDAARRWSHDEQIRALVKGLAG